MDEWPARSLETVWIARLSLVAAGAEQGPTFASAED